MKGKYIVFVLWAVAWCVPAAAQSNDSFEAYRKGLLENYSSFRRGILDDYAKFLDGIWKEYAAFRGESRHPQPKPASAPIADADRPDAPSLLEPLPEEIVSPIPDKKPIPAVKRSPIQSERDSFRYYCMSVEIPKLRITSESAFYARQDYSDLWRYYLKSDIAGTVLPAISDFIRDRRLGDWFVFDLVRTYAESLYPDGGAKMRISLEHFLLLNMGYDVRIGVSQSDVPVLLVSFAQKIYARPYLEIEGTRYFIFYDKHDTAGMKGNLAVRTCEIPKGIERGNPLDLVIKEEMNLPYKPHCYSWKHEGLEINGEFNENVIPMLYRHPQMPFGGYIRSVVSPRIREQVVAQFRNLLADRNQHQAVNSLLRFIQYAFDYATDDEQHGFEKPYFFEEILYYPKCDCEDRAIFFSYLLHCVLNVENHVISYPRHAAVAVHLDNDINGDGYVYGGKNFYISDPTYIGAVTGMCMPDCRMVQPTIEFHNDAVSNAASR